ncbi:MAG TPA: C25 family cysteine peptidase [Pyrinomonadaceae bacterium]
MKTPSCNRPGLRGPAAVMLSLVLGLLPLFQPLTVAAPHQQAGASERLSRRTTLLSLTAVASSQGVLLRWKTSFELDNVGFNVYRERNGSSSRINREIILGSAFTAGQNIPLRAGSSYSWFDAEGTVDSTYSLEALALDGTAVILGKTVPAWKNGLQNDRILTDNRGLSNNPNGTIERQYPTAAAGVIVGEGAREDQWVIAAQTGLKISIKKEGWYRVTQQQMIAAGFNPVTDIANLQLFLGARELAIRTNRSRGQFVSGDFIEFYGQGVDTPTTDTNVYYLIAGAAAGKRIPGGGKRTPNTLTPDSNSLPTPPTNLLPPVKFNSQTWFWWMPVQVNPGTPTSKPEERTKAGVMPAQAIEPAPSTFAQSEMARGEVERAPAASGDEKSPPQRAVAAAPSEARLSRQAAPAISALKTVGDSAKARKKRRQRTHRKPKYAHATVLPLGGNAVTFDYTVERKDRTVYFVSLINGDTENYFGAVLSTLPVDQTLTVPNPATGAGSTAQLQVALQGANVTNHTVNVQFNGVDFGAINFFGLDHKVQIIDVPVSQIQNGVNTVRLTPTSGSGLSIVDYLRLTYPHTFTADAGLLRFTLAPSQSARIDGFTTPNVRLIDYTDPFSVKTIRPLTELNGSSYTIQIPSATSQRQLYAIPEDSADQPAGLALNQPSSLNSSANGGDLLIIAHRSLIPSLAPLTALRTSQGLVVKVVDVEDVFDEFSFGSHGPQAIKDFLSWAATHWSTVPRYIILAGDATSDPRNYLGFGNLDFVPTKLVDATFSETASDDWLCDFNNDGAADIPIGRLPVRTPAEADLVISKIVNFNPANVPQTALLVADTQGTYYFNFEQANTQVQSLLPASMTVQRVDRRLEGSDVQARTDILAKFNAGLALVNYSGHGNVDTWTGGGIFTSDDAIALTNGNKLPFVVVMDCLNGYFQDPQVQSIAEALMKAPAGGAVAAFASSGSTIPDGQHAMSSQLYTTLYGSQSIALGDAIKIAKAATSDIDVRRTWVFFGDPSMRIR